MRNFNFFLNLKQNNVKTTAVIYLFGKKIQTWEISLGTNFCLAIILTLDCKVMFFSVHFLQSVEQNKKFTKDRALDSFDDFYSSVYGQKWKTIRAALLTEHKYVALVNNFGDSESTISALEADGMAVVALRWCESQINCVSFSGAINLRSIYESTSKKLSDKHFSSNQVNTTATKKSLERFLETKQQDEASVLYPEGFDFTEREDIPNRMESEERVDYKKSLTQTLEEDSDIDYRRTIDSSVVGAAGLHEFIPATKLKGMEDWVPESDHYKYYNSTTDFPLNIEMERDFVFPENLNVFTYEKGNVSTFIKPRRSVTGVLSHFLMDGASVLPPLALGIKPGDRVLDACAAPGGKSLTMLQTLYPEILVSNDSKSSRLDRINRIFKDYVIDYEEKWKNKRCVVTDDDARLISDYGMYDKVRIA